MKGYPRSRKLAPAVRLERIDVGVYLTADGRFRVVLVRPGLWVVTDTSTGSVCYRRNLYMARTAVGSALWEIAA